MTPEPTPNQAPPTAPSGWPVIVHPTTGDRMVFLRTTRATQGRLLEVQFDLPPGAGGPPLHTHRRTHERFEVVSGSLEMRVGTEASWRTLQEGEALEVPPGTPHACRNPSDRWATFVATVTPAGRAGPLVRPPLARRLARPPTERPGEGARVREADQEGHLGHRARGGSELAESELPPRSLEQILEARALGREPSLEVAGALRELARNLPEHRQATPEPRGDRGQGPPRERAEVVEPRQLLLGVALEDREQRRMGRAQGACEIGTAKDQEVRRLPKPGLDPQQATMLDRRRRCRVAKPDLERAYRLTRQLRERAHHAGRQGLEHLPGAAQEVVVEPSRTTDLGRLEPPVRQVSYQIDHQRRRHRGFAQTPALPARSDPSRRPLRQGRKIDLARRIAFHLDGTQETNS